MLHVNQVSYSRNEAAVLEGVELSVKPGTLLQIEGQNGSGKTTLIKIMSGLIPPESGSVRWHDRPIQQAESNFKGSFAFIGHKYGIKPDLTALENLEAHAGLSGGGDGVLPMAALERLGIGHLADTLCAKMSAGQKQRVALARLLVHKASLWLLDEPFANLDAAGGELLKAMISEQLEHGMVVVSTHRGISWDGLPHETYRISDG